MKPLKKVEHSITEMVSLKRGFVFWGFMTTLLLGALLSWFQFGKLPTNPNHYFVGNTPTATSPYFTTAWHIRYDSTLVNFNGANYPFNEHIGYAVNQPLLTELALSWHHHLGDLSDAAAGLINCSSLLFILLGAGALFLLLSKLHLPTWYAIIGALAITFLSPQTSAYPLFSDWAHPFFIPMLLYWLCRYEERSSRRYQSLHIAFLVTGASMLQPAYFGVSALFLTVFTGFQLLRKPSKSNITRRLSHWSVMTLIPLVALNIWIHWENYAGDRPAAAEANHLTFITIKNLLFPWSDSNDSLPYYTGMLAAVYLLIVLLSGLKMFGKAWSTAAYHRVHFQYLRGIFLASATLLIPALGFPGAKYSIAYLRIQDTAPLSWFFYYVVSILALYGAWNWGKRFEGWGEKKLFPQLKYGIIGLPLLILSLEALYTRSAIQAPTLYPNLTNKEVANEQGMKWLDSINFNQFQAILPLPYYHVGSRKLEIQPNPTFFNLVNTISIHTGLPNMAVFMKQTSLHQTLLSLQLVLKPGEQPALLSNLPDKRPLAVIINRPSWELVQNQYAHLLQQTTPIYQDSQLFILKLEIDTIQNNIKNQQILVKKSFEEAYPTQSVAWRATSQAPFFYSSSFDNNTTSKTSFQGKSALTGYTCDTTYLWRDSAPPGNYVFSCWIKLDRAGGFDQAIHFQETNNNSQISHIQSFQLKKHLTSIVKGWGCFQIPITIHEHTISQLFLFKEGDCSPFILDEILIRPANVDLLRREQGWMVRNNYWHREGSR